MTDEGFCDDRHLARGGTRRPDARRLAAFYTALGGWTEQYADDEWITLLTPDGWRIAVQRSPDLIAPRRPDPRANPSASAGASHRHIPEVRAGPGPVPRARADPSAGSRPSPAAGS